MVESRRKDFQQLRVCVRHVPMGSFDVIIPSCMGRLQPEAGQTKSNALPVAWNSASLGSKAVFPASEAPCGM